MAAVVGLVAVTPSPPSQAAPAAVTAPAPHGRALGRAPGRAPGGKTATAEPLDAEAAEPEARAMVNERLLSAVAAAYRQQGSAQICKL